MGTGTGNCGKYWNFSLAFCKTGKSFKMVVGPGKLAIYKWTVAYGKGYKDSSNWN